MFVQFATLFLLLCCCLVTRDGYRKRVIFSSMITALQLLPVRNSQSLKHTAQKLGGLPIEFVDNGMSGNQCFSWASCHFCVWWSRQPVWSSVEAGRKHTHLVTKGRYVSITVVAQTWFCWHFCARKFGFRESSVELPVPTAKLNGNVHLRESCPPRLNPAGSISVFCPEFILCLCGACSHMGFKTFFSELFVKISPLVVFLRCCVFVDSALGSSFPECKRIHSTMEYCSILFH